MEEEIKKKRNKRKDGIWRRREEKRKEKGRGR